MFVKVVVLTVLCSVLLSKVTNSTPTGPPKRISESFTDQWCADKFGSFVEVCQNAPDECCHILESYRYVIVGSCPQMEDTPCETGVFTEPCCKDGRKMRSRFDEVRDMVFVK